MRRWHLLPLPLGATGLRQPVHAEDLAAACVAALENSATYGKTYELGGGERLSFRSMLMRMRAEAAALPVPIPLAALALLDAITFNQQGRRTPSARLIAHRRQRAGGARFRLCTARFHRSGCLAGHRSANMICIQVEITWRQVSLLLRCSTFERHFLHCQRPFELPMIRASLRFNFLGEFLYAGQAEFALGAVVVAAVIGMRWRQQQFARGQCTTGDEYRRHAGDRRDHGAFRSVQRRRALPDQSSAVGHDGI